MPGPALAAIAPGLDAAWTDAVLATASWGTALWVLRRAPQRWLTPAGLVVLGTAAAVGTFRLGGVEVLGPLHDGLSRLAGLVGIPMAALGIVDHHLADRWRPRLTLGAAVAALPLAGLALAGPPELLDTVRTAVSGSALVAAIGFSARAANPWGVLGPVLVLVAGLGISGDGEWLGFSRDGWFHLAMAAAAACFAPATRTPDPDGT